LQFPSFFLLNIGDLRLVLGEGAPISSADFHARPCKTVKRIAQIEIFRCGVNFSSGSEQLMHS
jgi:hypothetical protein